MVNLKSFTLFFCRIPVLSHGLATLLLLASCAGIDRHSTTDMGNKIKSPEEEKAIEIPVRPVHMSKREFFAFMTPMIEVENARVLKNRAHLLQLKPLAHLQTRAGAWLHQIAGEYRVPLNGKPDNRFWHRILTRVDIIPLEIALAQAANESAWGNSRFAREANNYFGQWCFQKGCGVVPLRRNADARHEVKRFVSPTSSVRAYMKNVNTLHAYETFRKIRQAMRHQGKALDAELLALGLKQYSERGTDYVRIIRSIIRKNRKLMRKS